jgi:hypothetical protein
MKAFRGTQLLFAFSDSPFQNHFVLKQTLVRPLHTLHTYTHTHFHIRFLTLLLGPWYLGIAMQCNDAMMQCNGLLCELAPHRCTQYSNQLQYVWTLTMTRQDKTQDKLESFFVLLYCFVISRMCTLFPLCTSFFIL